MTARNPFDSLISITTFLQCFSHSKQIENKLEVEDPEWFETWIKAQVASLKRYQDEILRILRERQVPIIFLKFEQLRTEPREHLFDVFRFLLAKKDLSGTYVEHRIDEVLALGHSATQSYKLKPTDGKFQHAIDRFSPEL